MDFLLLTNFYAAVLPRQAASWNSLGEVSQSDSQDTTFKEFGLQDFHQTLGLQMLIFQTGGPQTKGPQIRGPKTKGPQTRGPQTGGSDTRGFQGP